MPIDNGTYTILCEANGKEVRREVEAEEICYDVIGMRSEDGKIILDHIPTGKRIARFANTRKAREAIRELMQLTNFKWKEPPAKIRPAVQEILGRLAL